MARLLLVVYRLLELLFCTLTAVGTLAPGSTAAPPPALRNETRLERLTINRQPMLLTKAQLADLDHDPANFLVATDSHHLELDYTNPERASEADGALWAIVWLGDLNLQDKIRQVAVTGWGSLTNFTSLASGLQYIQDLEEVHWHNHAPIPQVILSSITNFQPSCRLFYDLKFSTWDEFDRTYPRVHSPGEEPGRKSRSKALDLILNSKNLYSLRADIQHGSSPEPEHLPFVHQILTSCPNLREIDITLAHHGCIVSDGQPYRFSFSGSSRLAKASFNALETIRLSRYSLDGPYDGKDTGWLYSPRDRSELKWPWHHLPDFVVQNMPYDWFSALKLPWKPPPPRCCPETFNETTNLDGWLERMDFGSLQKLELGSISSTTIHKLDPVLTNLTSLTLHHAGHCAAKSLTNFLASTARSLQHLHVRDARFDTFDDLLENLMTKHGPSLQSLTLGESEEFREHNCWRWEDQEHANCQNGSRTWYDDHLYMNASQLGGLQSHCPNIHTLDIDMDRNLNQTEQKLLTDALGSFMNLSTLTLRLESPTFQSHRNGTCRRYGDCLPPALKDALVNVTWVKDIFHQIHSTQTSISDVYNATPPTAAGLRNLEIILGPWHDRHRNSMVGPGQFVLGHFECVAKLTPEAVREFHGEYMEDCSGRLAFPDEYMWRIDDYDQSSFYELAGDESA